MEAPDSDFGPRGSSSVINVGEQMLDKCWWTPSLVLSLKIWGQQKPEFPYGIKKYNKYNYVYSMYVWYVCMCVLCLFICCLSVCVFYACLSVFLWAPDLPDLPANAFITRYQTNLNSAWVWEFTVLRLGYILVYLESHMWSFRNKRWARLGKIGCDKTLHSCS